MSKSVTVVLCGSKKTRDFGTTSRLKRAQIVVCERKNENPRKSKNLKKRRCTTRLLRCLGTHTPLLTANARLDQAHAGPACALEALGCSNYAALMHWDYAVPYSDWLGHLILYRGLAWACCLRYRWRDELSTFRHAKSAYFKTDRKGYPVGIVQDLCQWASKD